MADTNYLYYGDQEIEQQALMNSLANEVNNYVASKSWSKKRKERFMSAYSDMINRGLKGASNDSGVWMVDFGGDDYIDQNTWSDDDRKAYEAAATFIHKQMSGLPTRSSQEQTKEDKDKKELTKFKNKDFVSSFTNRLVNDWFGGSATNYSTQWNDYDERGENGLRGINQRAGMLATSLRNYLNSLKDDQYDFADSPFSDINDFKTKIQTAIDTLESDNKDLNQIKKSLNVIGLNADEWFNNGSGDPYVDEYGRAVVGSDGKPLSYAQYYNNLALQEKTKQETEQKAAEEKQKALDALQVYTSKPLTRNYSLEDLANKYNNSVDNIISQYNGKNITSLSQDENDELLALFQNGNTENALDELSDDEWNILKSKLSLDDSNRNQFRKLKDLNGLFYNVNNNTLFQIGNDSNLQGGKNFLQGQSSKDKQQNYLNSKIPGLTNAEWQELTSIGLDIASIIYPGMVGSAALGIGAAGLRTAAKNNTPGFKRGFWDYVGEGVDYATGAIAAIPGLGDAGLGIKLAANSGKWLPLVTKALRLAARAGATTDVLSSASPATKAVYNKIVNGEDLTVGDWREVATLVRGLTGHGMLNRGNRAARKVLEESGYQTTVGDHVPNNFITRELAKEGFFSSKIKGEQTVPTLKLKKVGEDGKVETKEIEVSPENKTKLEEAFSKSKPEERTVKAKEILGKEMPEGYEVETNTGWWRRQAEKVPYAPKRTKDSFGTSSKNTQKGPDNFDNWLQNRNFWSRMHYGSDAQMLRLRKQLGSPKIVAEETSKPNENFIPETFNAKDPKINPEFYHNPAVKNPNPPKISEIREGMQQWKENNKGIFSTNKLTSGDYKIGTSTLQVVEQTDGTFNIMFKGNHIGNYRNQKDLQKQIFNIIKKQRRPDLSKPAEISPKEIAKVLKDLKKKGWLKHGGKITDTQIDNFLKQYKV